MEHWYFYLAQRSSSTSESSTKLHQFLYSPITQVKETLPFARGKSNDSREMSEEWSNRQEEINPGFAGNGRRIDHRIVREKIRRVAQNNVSLLNERVSAIPIRLHFHRRIAIGPASPTVRRDFVVSIKLKERKIGVAARRVGKEKPSPLSGRGAARDAFSQQSKTDSVDINVIRSTRIRALKRGR